MRDGEGCQAHPIAGGSERGGRGRMCERRKGRRGSGGGTCFGKEEEGRGGERKKSNGKEVKGRERRERERKRERGREKEEERKTSDSKKTETNPVYYYF
jgi:hypothetical protein